MIQTLCSSLALYHVHRNRQHFLTQIERRRAFWLCCAITAVLTFGVIMFILRYPWQ